ncbi:MAG: ATP-binding protein, partial [Bdellovibrionales bacterium]|nr:ATP-binding protein [Bdellovibrionales bacterium]
MGQIIKRYLQISLPKGQSAFLWGPRRVGKTYWLKHCFLKSEHHFIDLLKTDIYFEYASRPALLRERWKGQLTVIDEIQKIPALLDEIHWLIENKSASFLLTGSSARKLKRTHSNLLAGRAWRFEMSPLSFYETKDFVLEKVLNTGLLPPHFVSSSPIKDLRAYVSDYLREEIASEASVRNIPAFTEFLRVAALTSSELLNYTNMARETGLSAKVVRGYFEILDDTFLGYRLSPWRASKHRRMILTDKFYFFDIGIPNYLSKRKPFSGNEAFGKSFEHYIFMELMNYKKYKNPELDIHYWRTSSGYEVDFICGDMHTAIEVKASSRIHKNHLKGLKALKEEK